MIIDFNNMAQSLIETPVRRVYLYLYARVALWGLHMGFTQGLFATLVADTAPPELRGTAYGIFNLLCGLGTLVASILAGALWDGVGAQSIFLVGAAFSTIALAGLVATRRVAPRAPKV